VRIMAEKDILEEAKRILSSAEKEKIVLRLFGGMAVRFRCPSATHRQLQRSYADIDFMGLKKQSREITLQEHRLCLSRYF